MRNPIEHVARGEGDFTREYYGRRKPGIGRLE